MSQNHVTVDQYYLAMQQLKCTTEHKKKEKNLSNKVTDE
jgi:hypothetical protein